MLANSPDRTRPRPSHPPGLVSWRGHEARGVRAACLRQGRDRDRCRGPQARSTASPGCGASTPAMARRASSRPPARQMRALPYATGYFDLGVGAGDPPRRPAGRARAGRSQPCLFHPRRLGRGRQHDPLRPLLLACPRQSRRSDQFISLEQGYHGSTTVGAGLTALPAFHAGFGVPFDWQHKIPSHYLYRNPVGADPKAIIAASTAALRAKVEAIGGPERVAAFYAEPIQGSGGVLVPPTGWIKAMRELCAELRHPVRRRRGDHRLRPHRPAVRLHGRRHRSRPDDRRQGADLGLCADGRGASSPTMSTRRSPRAPAPRRSATASPIRRIRSSAAVALEVLEALRRRAPGERPHGRGAADGRAREPAPTTRWSATCAAAACLRRSNW